MSWPGHSSTNTNGRKSQAGSDPASLALLLKLNVANLKLLTNQLRLRPKGRLSSNELRLFLYIKKKLRYKKQDGTALSKLMSFNYNYSNFPSIWG